MRADAVELDAPVAVQATIVITTKDRRDDLRLAVRSALAQRGEIEVLVVDDGSEDGTSDMLATEFPEVRVHRESRSVGLIVARNHAARLAQAPVIVSIDDDAELPDPSIVERTLRDLASPRIGAVAIPHVDIGRPDGAWAPRAPDRDAVWVTAVFVGTAHALRRDVFLALGGYREDLFHQGEEDDLCVRMLDAGWWVRLGTADTPIRHHVSPRRDLERMDIYGPRNLLLHLWRNAPGPLLPSYLVGYAAKSLLIGLRGRRPTRTLRGLGRGIAAILAGRGSRRPVRRATWRVDRRLRRERAVRLEDVEPALSRP
jgi:glycosyltransferase involved in cell wall biosynthesis